MKKATGVEVTIDKAILDDCVKALAPFADHGGTEQQIFAHDVLTLLCIIGINKGLDGYNVVLTDTLPAIHLSEAG